MPTARFSTNLFYLYLGLCLAWLVGCGDLAPVSSNAMPTVAATQPTATVLPQPVPLVATATFTPLPTGTFTSTPQPTATLPPLPTTTFTPTPLPPVLALPPDWQTAVSPPHLPADWQILVSDDPTGLLATGQAQAALVHTPGGILVRQEPLAVAIPFTFNWDDTTTAKVQDIQANGHALAQILPWSQLTPQLKALRIDGRFPTDPDYPLQDTWSLLAAPGWETAVADLAAILYTPPPSLHLAAVGDLMLSRSLGYYLNLGELDYPFANVKPWLETADLTIGNLESSLGDVGEPVRKSYTFQAPPPAAASLALAGFDVLTLANNHAGDYGPAALQQGLELLHEQGIATIGAGLNAAEAYAPAIRQVNGLTVAFLGYVHVPVEAIGNFDTASWTATADLPGLAWGDPERITADVTAVKSQVDLVVVILHSGYEYVRSPSPPQIAAAHAAIDAGAALVIGHHAHILQGVEFYGSGVIVYGLGNFAFEIIGPPETAVLHVWLDKNGVHQLQFLPAVIDTGGRPRPAESWEAGPILQWVYALTSGLNAP